MLMVVFYSLIKLIKEHIKGHTDVENGLTMSRDNQKGKRPTKKNMMAGQLYKC